MKRVSIAGSCAVSIALVLTLWGSAPWAQATAPATQAAGTATATNAASDHGTADKQKPKPKLSPQLRIALGIYGKRKSKTVANHETRRNE